MRLALACLALLAVAASPRGGCGKTPYEPCAGKSCGVACTACAPGDSTCSETAVLKACDPAGECVAAGTFTCPAPPEDPCAGKTCGASCNPCGDLKPCPTFAPTACDRSGQCVTLTTSIDTLCYDPCARKACGDPCSPCPPDATGCTAILCMTSCNAAGECVCGDGGGTCK